MHFLGRDRSPIGRATSGGRDFRERNRWLPAEIRRSTSGENLQIWIGYNIYEIIIEIFYIVYQNVHAVMGRILIYYMYRYALNKVDSWIK